MAKALFGHVVAPAELRVAEENAVLRGKVRRLEQELARAPRRARLAHRPRAAEHGRRQRRAGDGVTAPPRHTRTTSTFRARGGPRRGYARSPVHLKSLTLKGFKSFASATTLRFEPGITAVVGPNGSGKSNVVDAIAWVLGEQGAKALRGGKMEDVIFAGTAGRPPLGRAEVTLTIDNTDGALPIDYTEVSITRRMFRSGESEYEINGDACRLLDIQELLSDSGIGREMHVIVGQGQLDAVLQARPEDRRGFIEEAAGVLKHRKRKEKALRKLDAMQANLDPADRPHRASCAASSSRWAGRPRSPAAPPASRPTCATPGCGCSPTTWSRCATRSTRRSPTRRRSARGAPRSRPSWPASRGREAELEAALAADAPALARAQETWYRLSALTERFRGTRRWPPSGPGTCRPSRPTTRHRPRPRRSSRPRPTEVPRPRRSCAAGLAAERERLAEAVAARAGAGDRRWPRPSGPGRRRPGGRRPAGGAGPAGRPGRRGPLAAVRGRGRGRAAGRWPPREAAERAEAAAERLAERRGHGRRAGGRRGRAGRRPTRTPSPRTRPPPRAVTELTEAERAAERDRAVVAGPRRRARAGPRPARTAPRALLGAGPRRRARAARPTCSPSRPGARRRVAAALGGMADAVAVSGVTEAARGARPTCARPRPAGPACWSTGGPPPVPRDGWPALPEGAALGARPGRGARGAAPGAGPGARAGRRRPRPRRRRGAGPHAPPGARGHRATATCVGADWAVGGQVDAPSGLELQAAVEEADGELQHAIARAADLRRPARAGPATPPASAPPTSTPRWPPARSPTAPARPRPRRSPSSAPAARSAAAEAERSTPPACAPSRPASRP